jgi:tetratricopeptide (TPR) repeat protein
VDSVNAHSTVDEARTTPHLPAVLPDAPDIAGYRITELIARGGMGQVYGGHDLTLDREVAIKTLLPGANAERFVTEAKITARLPHPNIPPVHALGTLHDGTPWLAMKRIRGRTLAELLKERASQRDDISRYVQVFEQIAQAVGFAHSRGILHRDLKPLNVMVGEFGEVQVMDWGLAKDVTGRDPEALSETIPAEGDHTRVGAILGTPGYMAPEQARGEVVDARADVFALGSILAAILTGKPAIAGKETREIIDRTAREELAEVYGRLEGCGADAELIALAKRCLAAKAETRPADARVVAAEVAAYRAGVEARLRQAETERAEAAVRVAETRKRQRTLLAAGGIITAVLVAGISVSLWQMFRAMKAEGQAIFLQVGQANAQRKAEERSDTLWTGLDTMTANLVGDSLATQKEVSTEQKKFLYSILPLYRKLAEEQGNDETTQARVARAAGRIGVIEYRLGRNEEGLKALRQARDAFEKLANENSQVALYHSNLAQSRYGIGLLLVELGKKTEAVEEYRKVVMDFEKLATKFPTKPAYLSNLAKSRNNLGLLLQDLGKSVEAMEQFRIGLMINERLIYDFPTIPEYSSNLAKTHAALGLLLKHLGKGTKAEEHFRQALDINKKLVSDRPNNPEYTFNLAGYHTNLGLLLNAQGKWEEAEKEFRCGLVLNEKLVAQFSSVPSYRFAFAKSHGSLGLVLTRLKKSIDAEEHYLKALEVLGKLAADFPSVSNYHYSLAATHINLGAVLNSMEKKMEAADHYQKGINLYRQLASQHPNTPSYRLNLAMGYNNLGNLQADLGKEVEAKDQYLKSLELLEKLVSDHPEVLYYHIQLGNSYCNFGHLLHDKNNLQQSVKYFDKAIDLLTPILQPEPHDVAAKHYLRNSYWGRARSHYLLAKYSESEKDWERTIELSTKPEQAAFRAYCTLSRMQQGHVEEAVAEVAVLTKGWFQRSENWYAYACVYALASAKIPEQRQKYADRAMELLSLAIKCGYQNLVVLQSDKMLDPLRERADFRKLMADLEAKGKKP